MADLRKILAVSPDCCPDCKVPVGAKHQVDCEVAICVVTGGQRVLHHTDPAEVLDLEPHDCGEDVWTGHRHGLVESVAYGLFVRPAAADDAPLSRGWIPCGLDHDGAVPDLDRMRRTGRWNPVRRRWEIPEEAAGRV